MSFIYERRSERLLTPLEFSLRLIRHGVVVLALVAVSLAVGILGYHYLARMGWIDAFLNASMILGGMGPVDGMPTAAAKVFAGCYALYSGIVLIAVAGIMIGPFAHRLLHKLHSDDKDLDAAGRHTKKRLPS